MLRPATVLNAMTVVLVLSSASLVAGCALSGVEYRRAGESALTAETRRAVIEGNSLLIAVNTLIAQKVAAGELDYRRAEEWLNRSRSIGVQLDALQRALDEGTAQPGDVDLALALTRAIYVNLVEALR